MALLSKLGLLLAVGVASVAGSSFDDVMAALRKEAFDEGRLAVLKTAVDTDAFSCDEIAAFMGKLTWSSNYLSAVKVFTDTTECTSTSSVVEPGKCEAVLKKFSSQADKDKAAELLKAAKPGSRAQFLSDEAIGQLLIAQSSGARSDDAFKALLKKVRAEPFKKLPIIKEAVAEDPSQFTADQLGALAGSLSFSSDKVELARMLEKYITGVSCLQAKSLLDSLPFSEEKMAFLTVLKKNIVDANHKLDLINTFPFDSDKAKAAQILRDICGRKPPPNNPVFGVVQGNPVVLVLDKSGSMSTSFQLGGKTYTRDSFSHMELSNVLKSLPPTNRFNIITFDSTATMMFSDAVLATPENVATAVQRAAGGIRGSTNSLAALRLAYGMPTSPEQIYFLSDGVPDQATGTILNEIDSLDRGRKIPVNAIAFLLPGKDQGANAFMDALAKKTGGFFRSVESLSAPQVVV